MLSSQQHQHIVFLNFYLFLDFPKIYLCDFIMIIKLPAVFQVWVFWNCLPSSWGVSVRHSFYMGENDSGVFHLLDLLLACLSWPPRGRSPFVSGRAESLPCRCPRSIFRPPPHSSALFPFPWSPSASLWFVSKVALRPLASSPSFPKFPQEPEK